MQLVRTWRFTVGQACTTPPGTYDAERRTRPAGEPQIEAPGRCVRDPLGTQNTIERTDDDLKAHATCTLTRMLASSDRHGVGQGRARFGYNAVNPSVCTNIEVDWPKPVRDADLPRLTVVDQHPGPTTASSPRCWSRPMD